MKDMKRYMFTFLAAALLCGGCKKFLDVNKDPNNPIDVNESLILAPVEQAISDNLYGGMGGNGAWAIQEYVQTIAPNQLNPGVWNYQLYNVDLDGDFYYTYVVCLNNLKQLTDKATSDGNTNYSSIAKILTAYTLGLATDQWGDIPYSKGLAGISNLTPAYDAQEDIYKTMQSLLDDGIADIGKGYAQKPAGDDYFYGGDMDKWTRLAYTLKARYYLHLVKAPGYNAATQADAALAALDKGMNSDEDDMKFPYAGAAGSENCWYLNFGAVSTFVLNSTLVDSLKARNDPRLPFMAKKAVSTGLYTGRKIGTPLGDLNGYSYPSDFYAGIDANNYIVPYIESLFLKAEATFRKRGAAAAQPVYQQAITQHMQKLGVSQANINAYLATRGTLTAANGLQRIMEEKGVGNFLSPETWTDWRRTGFPVLTRVDGALSEIPRRLLYPESEIINNKQPQQTAKLTDRLWWDGQ